MESISNIVRLMPTRERQMGLLRVLRYRGEIPLTMVETSLLIEEQGGPPSKFKINGKRPEPLTDVEKAMVKYRMEKAPEPERNDKVKIHPSRQKEWAMSYRCPTCGAKKNELCWTRDRSHRRKAIHMSRFKLPLEK